MGFNVSTCLDTESCLLALEKVINSGHKPKIITSDKVVSLQVKNGLMYYHYYKLK